MHIRQLLHKNNAYLGRLTFKSHKTALRKTKKRAASAICFFFFLLIRSISLEAVFIVVPA